MRALPDISVVMGVYNGAKRLRETIQSVLTQEGVELQLIVIDDGSTDSTPEILKELADGDSRVRVIRQDNLGLTRALIRGCKEATGEFIARQDCGDRSLPGRLKAQLSEMRSHPDAALVSCGTRFVGPAKEYLYDVRTSEADAKTGLFGLDLKSFRGPPCHPCTMFRKSQYESVGGYRKEFYFAQDIDLWSRLASRGRHVAIPSILYEAAFSPGGITGQQRKYQVQCAEILFECARLRNAGDIEATALAKAELIVPSGKPAKGANLAPAFYFLGMCLQDRGDIRARQYFLEALRANPLHVKSALRLLLNWRA